MFKNSFISKAFCIICIAVALVGLTSCASMKAKASATKEKGPDFAGDFDPVELGTIMSMSNGLTGLKPREITVYFVPRSNNLEFYFKDTINKAALVIPYATREIIDQGVQAYMTAYNDESTPLPERAPDKKNYYTTGKVSVSWGLVGLPHNGDAKFRTNYEYLEKGRPYFVLTVDSVAATDDSEVYSTQINLYFSPTQLETMYEMISQDALDAIIEEKETAAYTF